MTQILRNQNTMVIQYSFMNNKLKFWRNDFLQTKTCLLSKILLQANWCQSWEVLHCRPGEQDSYQDIYIILGMIPKFLVSTADKG